MVCFYGADGNKFKTPLLTEISSDRGCSHSLDTDDKANSRMDTSPIIHEGPDIKTGAHIAHLSYANNMHKLSMNMHRMVRYIPVFSSVYHH